jgi:hypothetical protein
VIGTLATRGTHLVPPLVVHTIDLFEPRELLEFLGFLGMLAHRLKVMNNHFDALTMLRILRFYVYLRMI